MTFTIGLTPIKIEDKLCSLKKIEKKEIISINRNKKVNRATRQKKRKLLKVITKTEKQNFKNVRTYIENFPMVLSLETVDSKKLPTTCLNCKHSIKTVGYCTKLEDTITSLSILRNLLICRSYDKKDNT